MNQYLLLDEPFMPNVTWWQRLICRIKHYYALTPVSRVLPPVTRCLTCGDDLQLSVSRGPYFCCRECHIEWGYYIGVNKFERPTVDDNSSEDSVTDWSPEDDIPDKP